eukprot:GILI01021955.1.p2 GENE.GILI01021955.1~~GILI01021955.1.p2  ORF type:complete len:352 (+),score=101.23 GILI01021955.1:65-1057(+)
MGPAAPAAMTPTTLPSSGSSQLNEVAQLKAAIEANPSDHASLNKLGRLYLEEGDSQTAVTYLHQAFRLNPSCVEYLQDLGDSMYTSGRQDEAFDIYQDVIRIRPNPDTYNNLAMLYQDKGDTDKAIEHFKKSLELAPNDTSAHLNLSGVYLDLHRVDEAVELLKACIERNPNYFKAYVNLGSVYMSVKPNMEEAYSLLSKAVELAPGYSRAHFNFAMCCLQMGEVEKALEHMAIAKSDPTNPQAVMMFNQLSQNKDKLIQQVAAMKAMREQMMAEGAANAEACGGHGAGVMSSHVHGPSCNHGHSMPAGGHSHSHGGGHSHGDRPCQGHH